MTAAMLAAARASVLQNLALGGGEPKYRGGDAIGAAEAVRQVALVAEARSGRDVGQRFAGFEQLPRPREPALQHVEMRRGAGLAPEHAEEMPAAHPRLGGE